ncbi:MAG: molybdopterin-dependent oxidoreductase [Candidatus Velthaea sp.]
MTATATPARTRVPTYCYQCVAGPDLLTVQVEGGVALSVEPNFAAEPIHPGNGKVCVKAYGLVQKAYNPSRILQPMKRTNPKKGRNEDPGFVPISWDEALDLVAGKLKEIRATGLLDASGYPRVAASFGGGGTPQNYMGTFPAFLAAWGPIDMGLGSGQGVKCFHAEHLYGEFWHRAFTVSPDTPRCRYLISIGSNTDASGGVAAVRRHADARGRGMKRVQVEPHLSVTGACSAEWVPIKPKTDAAFLYSLLHVMLHEHPRAALDLAFLRDRTASPYLVGPNGYYLRDPQTRKPLLWDRLRNAAVTYDVTGTEPALEGGYDVEAIETGPDGDVLAQGPLHGETGFTKLVAHVQPYSPEWAAAICDIPAATIRRLAGEYLAEACIGQTIVIDGVTLPFRPVGITLGKTVNNGWGAYECCWARTVALTLVGALEVPGGTLGTTVRLNRPMSDRLGSVIPGQDGFMHQPLNSTAKDTWTPSSPIRNAYKALIPLVASGPWSQALGPTQLAWMFLDDTPNGIPAVTPPDLWFVYRTNPAISFWDSDGLVKKMSKFPFIVAFAYTPDETNHLADVLLPEAVDIESWQLIRVGGTKYVEQFWEHEGVALRQAAIKPPGEVRDFTDIATDLARRTGLLEAYTKAINKGAAGVPLKGEHYDFSLDTSTTHEVEEIWDAVCRAASADLTDGASTEGLEWYKEHGFRTKPFSKLAWYLTPELERQNLRYEMPYQERLMRVGRELGRRLHEHDMTWWDTQLAEYQALPVWKDFPKIWETSLVAAGGKLEDFPLWLITAKSMQYVCGGNADIQIMREVSQNVAGHRGVILNPQTAAKYGIADGDLVEVSTPIRATRGRAEVRNGIRPDTLLIIGQFEHWAQPHAKTFEMPSVNGLVPMSLPLTDATGSGADLVRVSLKRIGGQA